MDSRQLSELKAALKQIIAGGDTGKAIEKLRQTIPSHSDKYNILIQLGRQYNELRQAEIKHTLGFDMIFNRQSALTDNVLGLIDMLSEEDFSMPSASGTAERKNRTGSILYAIPSTMALNKEKQCTIRLAFDEAWLLDNFFQGHDTHIRTLRRIDDRMEVELLDPNEEQSFAIRTISSVQQKVEKDDYTEWLYYVKPLKEGKFPLCLKVSVIILEEGEKVRKEIVLQEIIEVVSQLTGEASPGLEMRHSGFIFSFGPPVAAAPDLNDGGGADTGTGQTNLAPDMTHQIGGAVSKGLLKTAVASMTKIAAGVATLVTAGGIVYYTSTQSGNDDNPALNADIQHVKLNVAPPFSDVKINVAPSVHVIQPDKPAVLTMLSGARITIPASVFVTLDGRPVIKPVEIRFREFHKPAEIIASGIPMRVFDAQGREQWMQTAGMFEVEGFSEGQAVKIAQGKTITVDLASETGDNCDFWYFNPDAGNWENLGARPASSDSLRPDIEAAGDVEKEISKSVPPLKPQLVNKDKPVLDFDINYDALPELKNVGNILWQYAGDDPEEDPANNRAVLERQWDYVKVEPTAQAGVFQMVLTKGREKLTLPVKACSNKANYEKAMADYRENYKKYEAKREKSMEKAAFREEQEDFVRSMSVGRFGIYNWDYILQREDAVPVLADFDFGPDLPADMKKEVKVCLITGNGRSVITFTQDQWRNFTFSPGMDNKLIAILPGNRVATFSQEDFMREKAALQQARGKRYVFKMNVLPQSVNSAAELEKVTG